jgi:hypothetical protein
MRTTLDLPETLLDEATAVLGGTSKTDAIVFALRDSGSAEADRGIEELAGARPA